MQADEKKRECDPTVGGGEASVDSGCGQSVDTGLVNDPTTVGGAPEKRLESPASPLVVQLPNLVGMDPFLDVADEDRKCLTLINPCETPFFFANGFGFHCFLFKWQ